MPCRAGRVFEAHAVPEITAWASQSLDPPYKTPYRPPVRSPQKVVHAPHPEFRMATHAAPPRFLAALLLAAGLAGTVPAADWLYWRGPMQTGESLEKNLPDTFDPSNVVWKAPFGGRAAPLIMGGRVYILQGT